MAFLADDEENKNLNPQAPQDGQQMLSGPSGTLASSGGAAAAPGQSGAPASGARFQGITSYINNNRTAVQNLANKVGQGLTDKGQAARSTLDTQQQAFNNAVGSAEVKQDPGLQNQILTNATGLANNPTQRAAVLRARDAQYNGPKAFEDTEFYQPVASSFGDATRARENAKTAGGRMELLAQNAKPGQRITRGRLTLDEALLSGDPGARSTIAQAGNSLGDLEGRLRAASDASRARASEAAANTAATREATRGALGQATTNVQTGVDQRLAAARAEATARQTAAQNALKAASGAYAENGAKLAPEYAGRAETFGDRKDRFLATGKDTFNDQSLADLGLTRAQVNELLGGKGSKTAGYMKDFGRGITAKQEKIGKGKYVNSLGDLSRFLTQQSPDAQITRGNIASADDYARLAALSDLSGEQNTFLNPAEAAQAGTANLDLSDYNVGGLRDAQRQALQAAQQYSGITFDLNGRNGSDSFLKKHGMQIATGGLVPQGGGFRALGQLATHPWEGIKNILPKADMSLLTDPAHMFTDQPGAVRPGQKYKYKNEEPI
jgi:hypothetical protein